jgi:hypothetical protein
MVERTKTMTTFPYYKLNNGNDQLTLYIGQRTVFSLQYDKQFGLVLGAKAAHGHPDIACRFDHNVTRT